MKKIYSYVKRQLNRIGLIFKKKKLLIKWIFGLIIGALLKPVGTVIYDYYNNYKEELSQPKIEIQQNNPHPQIFELTHIEIPYLISNSGKTRANNLKIKLVVPNSAYVWSLDDKLKLVSGENNGIKVDSNQTEKHPKFLEFSCSTLDPNEIIIMYISVDRQRFIEENNLKSLKLEVPTFIKNQKIPRIISLTFDEGIGVVNNRDSLKLTIHSIPSSKYNLSEKLINGYNPNDQNLQLIYTSEFIEDLIKQTDYVIRMLRQIKTSFDSNEHANFKLSINNSYSLPTLPFLQELHEDPLVKKYTSNRFKIITEETLALKKQLDQPWSEPYLNDESIENIIKYYFNQMELYRILLNVENSWIKGETTKQVHDDAFDRYVLLNSIKNKLPIRPIEFNGDAFFWNPPDSILNK